MITEDYVSFETAKLLKEKGFPQSTFRCHYIIDGNVHYKSFENRCGFGDYDIIAPTLATAMKWLRKVYNIHIVIKSVIRIYGDTEYYYELYGTKNKSLCVVCDIYKGESWNSNEEACEVAIKYCLENLI